MTSHTRDQLGFRSVLAVCAHPDDESFGLGAVISTFGEIGIETSLLCFTHGEASTLGTNTDDLARRRAAELEAASAALGIQTAAPALLPGRPPVGDRHRRALRRGRRRRRRRFNRLPAGVRRERYHWPPRPPTRHRSSAGNRSPPRPSRARLDTAHNRNRLSERRVRNRLRRTGTVGDRPHHPRRPPASARSHQTPRHSIKRQPSPAPKTRPPGLHRVADLAQWHIPPRSIDR